MWRRSRVVIWTLFVVGTLGLACGARQGAVTPAHAGGASMYGGGDAYGGMGYAYGNGKGW